MIRARKHTYLVTYRRYRGDNEASGIYTVYKPMSPACVDDLYRLIKSYINTEFLTILSVTELNAAKSRI